MDRKVIERRLALFDDMAPGLNDLACFFRAVGNFRKTTPPDAVDLKRALDQQFHTTKYLMSPGWREAYEHFIDGCFQTYTRAGADAAIRADVEHQRRERGGSWVAEWADCFVGKGEATPATEVARRYEVLMEIFAIELGVPQEPSRAGSSRVTSPAQLQAREETGASGRRSPAQLAQT
ncbi:hypothetical protein [Actinomycetospora atypica]|uniref:Uncharacterized protein n=1 Tax=Actinomycetospora atypica TaxID=1290095 RepID=A0ABV9YN35_9PSEU